MQLSDLIERVEKLAGPDREADALVCAASGYEVRQHGGRDYYEPIAGVSWQEVPHYTGSIDDAVALTERLLPGWHGDIDVCATAPMSDGVYGARLFNQNGDWANYAGEGPTPAIALVLATLRAYAAAHPAEDGR